jgi:triosephosphate isomerase
MRKKIVAGNWKMNTDHFTGMKLASEVVNMVNDEVNGEVTVIVAPPFTHIYSTGQLIKDASKVHLAAQNCASELSGAFTGEVSVEMIKSFVGEYVIIGHSERRHLFGEDNAVVEKKVKLALSHSLSPIFCCGETLNERNSGRHFQVINSQLEEALFELTENDIKRVVIAYEPVWAIGTGVNATPHQAQEIHHFIRDTIKDKYNASISDNISILYGGSCNIKNAKELFSNADVDGGLIGGASLKSREFVDIVKTIL